MAHEAEWAQAKAVAIAAAAPSLEFLRGYAQALQDACCTTTADPRSLRYGRQLNAYYVSLILAALRGILQLRGSK